MKRSSRASPKGCLTLVEDYFDNDSIIPKQIILSDGMIKIGRGSPTVPVDIILTIKSHGKEIISRCHAEIIGSHGIYEIHDKRSINGVFVNHVRIDKVTLKEGDHVQFGGVAKVPVGKTVKVSAEHATYIFSYYADEQSNSSNSTLHPPAPVPSSVSSPLPPPTLPQQSKEERELLERNQQLQEEIDSLRNQLTALTKRTSQSIGINTSPLPRVPERTPESSRQKLPTSCSIDFSALEDLLKCSLCQMILLDAVVCRCSHGFCRSCLETYYRSSSSKSTTVSSSLASIHSICPICVGEAPSVSQRKQAKASSSTGQLFRQRYCRSSNLDSVVYLLQQTRSSEEMNLFTQREKEHHQILRSYGIDPQASPLEEEQLFQPQESGDVAEAHRSSTSSLPSSSAKRATKKILCDYCGEEGHRVKECPHDDQNERRKRSRYGQYHQRSDEKSDSDMSEST